MVRKASPVSQDFNEVAQFLLDQIKEDCKLELISIGKIEMSKQLAQVIRIPLEVTDNDYSIGLSLMISIYDNEMWLSNGWNRVGEMYEFNWNLTKRSW